MKIEQIYTGCLSEAAYYIESEGESLIIDPLREVEPYIEKAKENKSRCSKHFPVVCANRSVWVLLLFRRRPWSYESKRKRSQVQLTFTCDHFVFIRDSRI